MFKAYIFKAALLERLKKLTAIALISLFVITPAGYVKAADKVAGASTESVATTPAKLASEVPQAVKTSAASTSGTASQSNQANTNDTANLENEDQASSDATTQNKKQPSDNAAQTLAAGFPEKNPSFQSPLKVLLPQPDQVSGALVYEYPITIPPGRNGFQPDIKLQYNSQNMDKDSPLGYGWSFNIPYIQRLNKTGTDKLYTNNYFTSSLSGELVLVSGTTYAPKVETGDFFKYTFASNSWTVTDIQGIVYKFGAQATTRQDDPADSSHVYKWMLEEIRDTNNNYIKYEYFKDNGQIYPSNITYTGNGTTDGIFRIDFLRQSRSDVIVSGVPGFLARTSYRINEIQAKVNGSWVRKCALGYTTGVNGGRLLLSTITESGQDDGGTVTTLPAETLIYQAQGTEWASNSSWAMPITFTRGSTDPNATAIADINGDGLLDEVFSGREWSSGCNCWVDAQHVWLNNGNGFTQNTSWSVPEKIVDVSQQDTGTRITDINGDGLADLVFSGWEWDNPSNTYVWHNRVYINSGSGWILDSSWSIPIPFVNSPFVAARDKGTRMSDINGDGLPDIISAPWTGSTAVYLNTGTGWTANANWVMPVRFMFNDTQQNASDIADVNGDGLADVVFSGPEWDQTANAYIQKSHVWLNNGNGWTLDTSWSIPEIILDASFSDAGTRFVDINGDGLADVLFSGYEWDTGTNSYVWHNRVDINTGTGWVYNSSLSIPESFIICPGACYKDKGVRIADVNGDGLPDIIRADYTGAIATYINTSCKIDSLIQIINNKGGITSVSYKPSAQYMNGSTLLNPKMPMIIETVSQITNNDGSSNTNTAQYQYGGGEFYFNSGSPLDRKFAGFAAITKTDAAGNTTKSFYHQGNSSDSSHGEYSDEYWKIGKLYRVEVASSSGSLYAKTLNKWESADLGGAKFVKLAQTVSFTYDGDFSHRDKAEGYIYDNTYGNLTQKTEYGEVTGLDDGTFTDIGNDKFTTTYIYAANAAAYIVGLPSQSTTTDQSAAKVKESKFYYDLQAQGSVTKGNLTKQEDWKTGSTYINSQRSYNSTYGTVISETNPRGKTTNYSYDTYNLYPVTITNPLTQATQYTYDYSSGQVKQKTDSNTRVFQYIYDGLDRLVEEKQPDLTTPATLVTKTSYIYTDTANAVSVKKSDYLDSSTVADSYAYFDGLGRKLQERKEAEGSNFAVKDYAYNNQGLLLKESLPYFSTGSSKTSATTDTTLYAAYSYDPMLRITTTVNNIGITTNIYNDWRLTISDMNGKTKDLYKDAYGNLVQVDEHNGTSTYSTYYTYNYLGSITKIIDALGNIRNFIYDGLGRRLTAQDLHAAADTTFGTWAYAYDDSGNLISKTDQKNQTINYTYDDLDRVLTEDFTGQTGIEVNYTYDSCPGGISRLCSVVSSGASESRQYNAIGLVTRETKTIISTIFQTDYTYDRLGNVLIITNPDGSQIKYEYNTAGLLDRIRYKEAVWGDFSDIISNFDYGPLEKVSYQEHANGAKTTNTYDATKLYRLNSKVTTLPITGGTSRVQDISYTYDPNGNITQITDNSVTNAKKTVAYIYDALNRLTSATCVNAVNGQNYSQSYIYDGIGNITSKNDQGTYSYNGHQGASYANSHAVTSIGTTSYAYDNNGNLTAEGSKSYAFDYANRLVQASPSGGGMPTTLSFYPAGGDGSIYYSNTSWDTAHDATSGSNANTTASTLDVKTGKSGGTTYRIERAFLPFDTSSLPDNATITDAKLKVYVASKSNNDNDGDDWVTVVQTAQPSTSSLSAVDYDLAGSINTPTEGVDAGERKDITAIATGAYLTFTLNATGRSWINRAGLTKLGLREGHDVIDSPFSGSLGQYNQLQIRTSEYTSTSSDPILEVTYTSGPPPITFSYDYQGQRVTYYNGSDLTVYPSKNYNATGTSIVKHIFAGDQLVATVRGSSSNVQVFSAHTDHLSGSSVISNQMAMVEEVTDYFPYGEIRLDEKAGTFSEQRKFTGQEYDVDTRLSYMNARYYNSAIGRFVSQDPAFVNLTQLQVQLADPQSWNSYAYARNNPLAYIDPTGNIWTPWQSSGGFASWMGNGAFLYNLYGSNVVSITNSARDVHANGFTTSNATALVKDAAGITGKTGAVIAGGLVIGTGAGFVANAVTATTTATTATVATGACASGGCQKAQGLVNQGINQVSNLSKLGDLPMRASAVPKIQNLVQQFGMSKDEILQQASQSTQRFIDNTTGNINVWISKPSGLDGFIRITTNPEFNAIISAGQNRASQVINGIANGRFTPLK